MLAFACSFAPDGELRPLGPELDRRHARRAAQLDPSAAPERAPQHRAEMSVADRVAEGRELVFGGVEPRKAEVAGIRDMNLAYWGRAGRDLIPDPEGAQDLPRAIAQGSAAIIEARLRGAVGGHGLDQQYLQPRAGQRQRQTRPDHAATDDGDIAAARSRRFHAAAINASISSGSFGASSVSTSQPPRVTATSSSMRTPIFQKRRDTLRVPAAM